VLQQRIDCRVRADQTEVDEQASVAIFRQRRELARPFDRERRCLERREQRIGEPLRELVERHDTVGAVAGAHGGMPAGIADRTTLGQQG
jgi:hypothetical protein